MKKNLVWGILLSCLAQSVALGAEGYLVRFHDGNENAPSQFVKHNGGQLEIVSEAGNLYQWTTDRRAESAWRGGVEYIEKNKIIHLMQSPSLVANRAALLELAKARGITSRGPVYPDNPPFHAPSGSSAGPDPLLSKAWGMANIGATDAWGHTAQGKEIIVAVTDTGVDYNHEDLINQMWRNPGEKEDGIDNDNNGFIDDMVGWDFASNDNKPYDLSLSVMDILTGEGNPGHGTHCSGVVGAQLNNALGTAGVAPQVKIMALRFITEKGQGATADAIKAIDYAVKMHANIISASWGGEKGSDGDNSDKALSEAIQRAGDAGVIFVAAAGNGHTSGASVGVGYDNDSDPKPMIPASLPLDNIVTVAAYDASEQLAAFSNWGAKSVTVGAPGVKILSTVPGSKYQDTVIDLGPLQATWDGTSMATPFVAGSLAVIWSQHPGASWKDVKQTLLSNAKPISSLTGKVSTGGKVDLHNIN